MYREKSSVNYSMVFFFFCFLHQCKKKMSGKIRILLSSNKRHISFVLIQKERNYENILR